MKTLMATDGSNEANVALRAAARLVRKSNNEVHVLCVAPELRWKEPKAGQRPSRGRIREKYGKKIKAETAAILKQAQDLLSTEGVEAEAISRIGSPAEEIVNLADEYDLTVVGARSRYNRSALGLGPVASRVVELASGAVLLARELPAESALRVLVGVDGSLASNHALRTMAAFFNIDEAEITLMHVVEMPWIHLGLDPQWFDYGEEDSDQADPELHFQKELRLEAEDIIEDARAILADRNCSIMVHVEEGTPATELIGAAESKDYDLIVLGATGVADAKHSVLGSVSAKVAWNATCSVALVKYVE